MRWAEGKPYESLIHEHEGQQRFDFAQADQQRQIEEIRIRKDVAPAGGNYGKQFRRGRVRKPSDSVSGYDPRSNVAKTPPYVIAWLCLVGGIFLQLFFGDLRCHSSGGRGPGIEYHDY
jgi:hypothetical protein